MTGFSKGVPLTRQEQTILNLLGQQYGPPRICTVLNISISTYRHHTQNIRAKFRVQTTETATRLWLHQQEQARQQVKPATLTSVPSSSKLACPSEWFLLTEQERKIALLLTDPTICSLTETALAHRLHITTATLKKHLQRIYRKLDVGNRASAALIATQAAQALGLRPEKCET